MSEARQSRPQGIGAVGPGEGFAPPLKSISAPEGTLRGREAAPSREWSFAERYPALAYLERKGFREIRGIRVHYERAVEFTRVHVAPRVLEIDRRMFEDPKYYPADLMRTACAYGLFSVPFPRAYGGLGLHPLATVIGLEVIATSCVGIANLIGVSGLAIAIVLSTMDLRAARRVAEMICEGERRGEPEFLSTCVTEPGSGSDSEDREALATARLCTVARPAPGGYRLSGTKVFISNASLASLHVVLAVRDLRDPVNTLTVLLVPSDAPGVSISRLEKKMGQKVCPAAEVVFDDVFVPEAQCCRTADLSGKGIANVLALTRAGVGAFATGVAEGAYRLAHDYARTHCLLGVPLHRQQWAELALAQMARRAELARASYVSALLASCEGGLYGLVDDLTHGIDPPRWIGKLSLWKRLTDSPRSLRRAARALERQRGDLLDAAAAAGDVAKVSSTDLALENCHEGLTLMGKDGMRHGLGAEKLLRDARLLQIYEGTNQVNLMDFAKRRMARRYD